MTLRIYTPGKLPKNAPIVMELHGCGFVGGNLNIDNYRCITIAAETPAIVVGVDYRLSVQGGVHFPQPLMDCYAALEWIHMHAEELVVIRRALHFTAPVPGGVCVRAWLYMLMIIMDQSCLW